MLFCSTHVCKHCGVEFQRRGTHRVYTYCSVACARRDHILRLEGCRFGELVVLRFLRINNYKVSVWECACSCGKIVEVTGKNLRTGDTKSCGHLHTKHGQSRRSGRSRTYKIHHGMVRRCTCPSMGAAFKRYGARGITVDPRWLGTDGFKNFLSDMGEWPGEGYSIDRIDNRGNYSPSNCRWATKKQQMANRQNTIMLTVDGVTKPLLEWADECGIRACTIRYRKLHGWSDEDAVKRRTKPWRTYAACGGGPSSASRT